MSPDEKVPLVGKVRKQVIHRMIASGRYSVRTSHGTEITDWTKLMADLGESRAFSPKHGVVSPCEVGGKTYTRRQLEHFGDAVVSITSRIMAHELVGLKQKLYFNFAEQLVRNKTLGEGNSRDGSTVEVQIGLCFVREGFEAAMKLVRGVLEKTPEWKRMTEFMKSET